MLFRLVRPVRRKGSRVPYFVQRIPADVLPRAAGVQLAIPLGNETVQLTIGRRTTTIRLSLRTDDPSQAKVRQAGIAAYLESVWQALRADAPVSLTRRQATALAGELYRAWADGEGRGFTMAIEYLPNEPPRIYRNPPISAEEIEAVLRRVKRIHTLGKHEGDNARRSRSRPRPSM
jgi:hypothetical protein